MARYTHFEVEGLKELEDALLQIEKKTAIKTLRQAGKEAMKPVLDSAIANVNVNTGDTRRAMTISFKKGKGSSAVKVNVGATRRKALKSQGGHKLSRVAQKVAAQEYGTAKQKAEPFLRQALANNVDRVLALFKKTLAEKIGKL